MPHFTRASRRGSTARAQERRYADAVGQVTVVREIAEAGELALELQFDRARRTVALLADDDFGLAVRQSISSCHFSCSGVPGCGSLFCR